MGYSRLMLTFTEVFEGCKYSDLLTGRTLRILQQSAFLTLLNALRMSLIIYFVSVCFDRPGAGSKRAVPIPLKTSYLLTITSARWI